MRFLIFRNSTRRARPGLAAALAAAALLAGLAAGCGGSDDEAAPTSTSPDPAGPVLSDADQRVVSVLLGFVRVVNEERRRVEACADDACREAAAATLEDVGGGVERELDDAGEPSDCLARVADSLRSAAETARGGGDDALEEVRAQLSEAGSAAGAC